jgi:hypothetical protein
LKSRKGYLSGGIAAITASIPDLQLVLFSRPSGGHHVGICRHGTPPIPFSL